jgi:DNA polymerase-3 subunit epsilon
MSYTTRPIYYDTETTGIKSEKDRIVEIAAYDPVLNRTFEKLVNPGCPIPPDATAIHHITDEMVAQAGSFAEIGAEFIEFCSGDVILIAHNNDNFDIHFLKQEYARHHLTMPAWKCLDSLKWARRYRPDLPRHTLQFLREMYGIPSNQAHRALDDVIVLHQLFSLMIDDLHIQEVFDLLNRPRTLQHMPFGKHQGQPLAQIPKNYVQWLAQTGAFDKPENQELKDSFIRLGLLNTQEILAGTAAG